MSKYIDEGKLKAHIEAKMEILWDKLPDADKEHPTDIELRDLEMYMALEGLIDGLDSLQQDQPDFPTTDEQMKEFLATHPKIKVPEKYKNPDWLFKKQEKPEVDMEKEIDACWRNWLSPSNQKEVEGVLPKTEFAMYARHFYELGIKARKV